ncbi:unnamed protein product [Cylicocyclus nassatus]|uniref:Uncharacterized protein n=1 Tax=Cylicocyclus nassatus TaxID=53992 RepID=A0AA36DKR5_CYLNA|nr:unnamed protein product [Cylicocyclus nassatus]
MEIMAGSYIAKNTMWARSFLHVLANHYKVHPDVIRRSDNFDLMVHLAELLSRGNNTEVLQCLNMRKVGVFVQCVRILFEFNSEHLKIYPRGEAWARDIWLTTSFWSEQRDFMLHGCKENTKATGTSDYVHIFENAQNAAWHNPIAGPMNFSECRIG